MFSSRRLQSTAEANIVWLCHLIVKFSRGAKVKIILILSIKIILFMRSPGEDGKLGHNNRDSYDRPKLIESFSGLGIVDIACGSAHSAAVSYFVHVIL